MANMDQVQIVRRGRDPVAQWREEHPGEVMDLYNSYMSHVRIPQVDLSGADLRDSDFMGAMLRRANLTGCYLNPVHFYRADLREANLSRSLMSRANLRGADLRSADLQNANLDQAVLSDTNLSGANLTGANLSRTNLDRANLTGANLTGVTFHGANLTRTILREAIFQDTDFYEAVFNETPVTGAKFSGSIVGYTTFRNCNLSDADGLEEVRHDAPSTLGIDTFLRSGGGIPNRFLQGVGIPESLLAFQQSLQSSAVLSGDYFISCTNQDIPFAETLRDNLRQHGVRSWLFSEGSRGNALVDRRSTSEEEEVERWVRHYDKLIVICSQASFESEIIRTDISEAKDLQQSRDEWIVYLVAPDNAMINPRARAARNLTYEHKVFDLREQDGNSEEYQQQTAQLAQSLLENQPASAGVPEMGGGI